MDVPAPPEPPQAAPVRYDNDAFFADRASHRGPGSIPGDVFYAHPAPPAGTPLATWAAGTTTRFALVLTIAGWAGIAFQRNFFQQVVVGAPVFEELAKLGPPLLLVALLGLRGLRVRVLFALASGAGFGVFEHLSTYSEEDVWLYAGRVAFHAASTGLSMAFFCAFESTGDVRARWASTVVSTLLHWANNFGALVFAFAALLAPALESVALGWAGAVTLTLLVLTVFAWVMPRFFVERSRDALHRAVPRLAPVPAEQAAIERMERQGLP